MSLAPDITELELPPQSKRGDWTWEVLSMFPRQGEWTESEFLAQDFRRLVEYVDGVLEFLPMTTFDHQDLVDYLFQCPKQFIGQKIPREVYCSPIHVRTVEGHIREPDVAYIRAARIPNRKKPSEGADLVMEIVSESSSDRDRDYVKKREEYASAEIPEYWIVDPALEVITVLALDKNEYRVHGEFKPGDLATSVLLPGFQVEVSEVFTAGKPK
jgi:Uma2 family endonuclease